MLHAERVKTFDLNDQILDVSGKKVDKFKIKDVTISTNLSLSVNQDYYSSNKNGYFAIEFDKLENNFELHFKLSPHTKIWRFIGNLGESIFIYVNGNYFSAKNESRYTINGKVYKGYYNSLIKVIVKKDKLTLYSNEKIVAMVNISNLKGIKAVEFEDTQSVSDFFIIKDK
jgi:hypothetical protein